MKPLLIVITLLFNYPVFAWDNIDTSLFIASNGLLLIDCGQTLDMQRINYDGVHETNAILGRHPTKTDIYGYISGVIVINSIAAATLPKNYRRAIMLGIIATEITFVINNHKLGLRVNF